LSSSVLIQEQFVKHHSLVKLTKAKDEVISADLFAAYLKNLVMDKKFPVFKLFKEIDHDHNQLIDLNDLKLYIK
jgi:hypothetical protein